MALFVLPEEMLSVGMSDPGKLKCIPTGVVTSVCVTSK